MTPETKLSRFLAALKEFFEPRTWIPTIPLPPKSKGPMVMTLFDAIKGFPKK